MSKEQIMTALKALAEKLGRTPRYSELNAEAGVSHRQLSRWFSNYTGAVRACGLRLPDNARKSTEDLFQAWAGLVRKLGKTPNTCEFELHTRMGARGLRKRWGSWANATKGLVRYGEQEGKWAEWPDVLQVVKIEGVGAEHNEPVRSECDGPLHQPGDLSGNIADADAAPHLFYGEPVWSPAMSYAPTNEAGVLFAFGMMAAELGYMILKVQAGFPDCEVLRRLPDGRWKLERVELEFESRNFVDHGHDPAGCDMIVCWVHNWKECPMPVLELSKVIGRRGSGDRAIG